MNSKFIAFYSIIFILLFLFTEDSSAQLSSGGLPYSFINKTSSEIKSVSMQAFDVEAMRTEDILNEGKLIPYRFGKVFDVDYTPDNSGTTEILSNGDKLWRLQINSKQAYSIGITFGKYKLPKGAKVFIYSPDKKEVQGAFTELNNKEYGRLALAQMQGSSVIVEYYEPVNSEFKGELQIYKVVHDYQNAFGKKVEKSESCNININCPTGDDWQTEKHAVCKIVMGGGLCSGALINNTTYDGTPYFLTAYHCLSSQADAQETVFHFNYESEFCGGVESSYTQSVSGSDMIATSLNGDLDFTLLKISETPPAEYNPYYAGWDRGVEPPQVSTGIHHPKGDIKKISVAFEPPHDGTFSSDKFGFMANSHWLLDKWTLGIVEGGSSGSPCFDQNHRIIGDLTGSNVAHGCNNPIEIFYAKFSESWNKLSGSSQQLKPWLDPNSSGVTYLDGFSPFAAANDVFLSEVIDPVETAYCTNKLSVIPKVVFYNKGNSVLTSAQIKYSINEGDYVLYDWTGQLSTQLSDTVSFPQIDLESGDYDFKFVIENPNGVPDENTGNNEIAFSIAVSSQAVQMKLQIITDEHGSQTTWACFDQETKKNIYSGGPYKDGKSEAINNELCFKPGCYDLYIYDSGADGLCCTNGIGFYKLTNIATGELIGNGSSFGSQERVSFCVSPAGIMITDDSRISIYPNPVDDLLIVETSNTGSCYISISDIYGKIIYNKPLINNKLEINTSDYTSGIYFIEIKTNNNSMVKKFVKL